MGVSFKSAIFRYVLGLAFLCAARSLCRGEPITGAALSLDGTWKLAVDPTNAGRNAGWFKGALPGTKDVSVPGIIQVPFPGYHGVAWYGREFATPSNPFPGSRVLLRFWAVDYLADVWVNGIHVGGHEGGETPFVLDVTDAVKPGGNNWVAVRVLNPTDQPIDGIVLGETPHRNKVVGYSGGSSWDHGGIVDTVELLVAPPVRVADVFVKPDWKTGSVHVRTTLSNATNDAAAGFLSFTIAPAMSGEILVSKSFQGNVDAGETTVETDLAVPSYQLWQLNDPQLYRLTVGISITSAAATKTRKQFVTLDESSTRFGFRDFRFEDGYFRLNGKRVFLRSSHTGNHVPIGEQVPLDPGLIRRDLVLAKAMGFNTIRFGMGLPTRYQLDLCDELGLMAYEESYASWLLGNSPRMPERFDRSTREMILRDRNHPSVVAWGLLNETFDGPVARHALASLPVVRSVDDTRLVFFSSGRWDKLISTLDDQTLQVWRNEGNPDPNVTHNPLNQPYTVGRAVWAPDEVALHPGPGNEFSAARFIAPANGQYAVDATFKGVATPPATTDVHILKNGEPLFNDKINLNGRPNSAHFANPVKLAKGETLDFVVGSGNGNYGSDTTALSVQIRTGAGNVGANGAKPVWGLSANFSATDNPTGPWAFGSMQAGPTPNAKTFAPYAYCSNPRASSTTRPLTPGSVSNPFTDTWQDVLGDLHTYPRFPHSAAVIHDLRTVDGRQGASTKSPLLISEYGVGSAVDLVRVVNLFEQAGHGDAEDAHFYRAQRDRFLADWNRWSMRDAFGSPEDYFNQCIAAMAQRRLIGLNALRSNPHLVGHSMSGTVDQGMSGEGLFTTFREFKPGTVDAIADGLAPLRWCLFAEPPVIYRGGKVRVEAVLADEDVLLPGDYAAHMRVFDPDNHVVLDRVQKVSIAARAPVSATQPSAGAPATEPSWVHPVIDEEIGVDGPPGKYRLEASFDRGAAAAGGTTSFYVEDAAAMPPVKTAVTLWGEDPPLAKWLTAHQVQVRSFDPGRAPAQREVFLVSHKPAMGSDGPAFPDLARRIARGSTAIFLSPDVFARDKAGRLGWLPLANKGAGVNMVSVAGGLYLKDDWAKAGPAFAGLPLGNSAGGLLDPVYYRDLIPDAVYIGLDAPAQAIAGANNTAINYSSGLELAVYRLGEGKFVLNTFLIEDNLDRHPAAERLLRNLLNDAATETEKPLSKLPERFDEQLRAMGYPVGHD